MTILKTSLILKSLEERVGCKILLEPKFNLAGSVSFEDGRIFYFKNTSIDINNFGAAEIAKDKGYTRFFMENAKYPIPKGATFFSDHWCKVNMVDNDIVEAIKFADQLGYPIILKPNNKSQGEDVFKIYDATQLNRILSSLFERHNIVLIEEYIPGNDYRIVVLDDEVVMAYQRVPSSVIGTGKDTIVELFTSRSEELKKIGRPLSINIDDQRIQERLSCFYKVDANYIPEAGQEIVLLDNANLSTGGVAVDVTGTIHRNYIEMATKLTKTMGLRFAGVDLITADDITQPPISMKFIEINSSPGLSHFASLGQRFEKRVEQLYLKILIKLKNMV